MITVHHLNNSKSQRILWLLEELGLAYTIRHYQRQPSLMAPPEMKSVHPLGKSPIVEIDGRVMAESGAIVDYVVQRHGGGRLRPDPDSGSYAAYLELLHYAEGSANTMLLLNMVISKFQVDNPVIDGYLASQITLHFNYLEGLLNGRTYFVGDDFTAADLHITFNLQMAQASRLIEDRPALLDFIGRMERRPAYKRAMEKGGAFDLRANRA
ncbi:glutathione S-transferase [Iodidimonas sp. SYSU 1G8]|uniref:glutathione S-transferase family protein n=1 Tax=Iodidimonas sp. SYSU 1G8 TaxID=3133967 RepID=UPI0031FED15B